MLLAFYTLSNCLRGRKTAAASSGRYSAHSSDVNNPSGVSNRRSGSSGQQRSGLVGAIGGRGTGGATGSRSSGQKNNVDEENRLIDQLDEEWDD